jgi:hypothetical protein
MFWHMYMTNMHQLLHISKMVFTWRPRLVSNLADFWRRFLLRQRQEHVIIRACRESTSNVSVSRVCRNPIRLHLALRFAAKCCRRTRFFWIGFALLSRLNVTLSVVAHPATIRGLWGLTDFPREFLTPSQPFISHRRVFRFPLILEALLLSCIIDCRMDDLSDFKFWYSMWLLLIRKKERIIKRLEKIDEHYVTCQRKVLTPTW